MGERAPTFEGALAFAQRLIRTPSPPGGEGDVSRMVAEEMRGLGFVDVETDELGSAVGRIPGRGDGPSVMLSCHLDVVAEGDPSEWEVPPFSGEVRDGQLHGRGAMDIKGPLAIQTYAAAALASRAGGDVIVAHTVLEERGGWGMEGLMDRGELRPGAVIIGESTHGDIAIGHRGRTELEVVIRGVAGHASAPDRARNALDMVPAVLRGIEAVNRGNSSDPVLGKASAVATGIEVRPESRNVIPDEVIVVVDWRILPVDSREGLMETLKRAIVEQMMGSPVEGFRIEVRTAQEEQHTWTGRTRLRDMFTPGFITAPDAPVALAAAAAVGRRDGKGPASIRPWLFATDGGWTCGVHGVPTIGFAPGEERFAHTNRERLDVEEARWAYSRYPDLIEAVRAAL